MAIGSPRKILPWVSVAALLLLTAGAATGSVLTAPGHAPPRASSETPESAGVPTSPTVLPSTTLATAPAPPSTTPSSPTTSPPPVTTTTIATLTSCGPSQFSLILTTNQAKYSIGQAVQIRASIRNDGPACTGLESAGPEEPNCFGGVRATNQQGQVAWDSGAGTYDTPTACPVALIQTVPSGWSATSQTTWTQDECPYATDGPGPGMTNPQCTQVQVPPGDYSLVADWALSADNSGESQSPPVTIAIAAS